MGLCFSKKKPPATPAGGAKKPGKVAAAIAGDDKGKKTAQQPKRAAKATGEAADAGKASVFVVRAKDAAPTGGEEKKKRPGSHEPAADKPLPVVVVPSAPVRTSSCTKEEVDAILIQCGRLSRSSSGTGRAASSETGGHRRRRSESKRSYDFDQDARPAGADEDWERQGAAAVSRPSPHRGSPQRKRSGSRERSGGGSGSRRASRSPGRRTDGAAAGSGGGERGRQQQPGKMVSVPAREKGRAPSPAAAASGKRCASPRSSSPARMVVGNENAGCGLVTGPTPALSRSSSRKAEQSPYRRNPMAELDENSLRNNNNNHNAKPQKKSIENAIAATPKKKATERGKESTVAPSCRSGMEKKTEITEEDATVVVASETRAPSSKTSATRTASVVAESLSQRQPVCRSRRASRDFDQNPGGSYTTTQLLEDIHSYHQQSSTSIAVPATTPATPSFSLPACVAKACSIVEAVADLNSTSSENRTYEYEPGFSADDKGSVNAGRVEPSAAAATARKHAQPAREFRAEAEPQESAGSNSVVSGQPWTPSWEPTSVESTDRTWSTGDEVVEQSGSYGARCSPMNNRARQSKQRSSQMEPSGRSRAGSGNGNTLHRGRSAHRGSSSSVASGRSGVRVVSAAS
ncbi:hypothetical protein HU200_039310 [Digitaria exilis]|uniref:Uncharacterized protein n=1 Tax=Digitaria exilis TaxID=1010633 RepID=A0A835BH70_9POAL|nr:hypothetical protein HU200_039310 [Digitaria exilis]CAB3447337.1 unnamed protein product [Digitaria exilis]